MKEQEIVVKDFTTIEQSKVLSEFLPHETANMVYCYTKEGDKLISPIPIHLTSTPTNTFKYLHCWSLAALLNVLPTIDDEFEPQIHRSLNKYRCTYEGKEDSSGIWRTANNPVDACYDVIIKLHELKLL